MSEDTSIIPVERVEQSIYLIRGHKVMLDRDLAGLYGVETRVLNQAVKRNTERFPSDFMFEAINELMIPPEPKKNPIGFHVNEEPAFYTVRVIS